MSDTTNNGWSNHATWQANFWLDEIGEIDPIALHADFLYDLLYECALPSTELAWDIFNSWVREVNFHEIIEAREEVSE